ncbi:MAG: hypothetical protein VB140_10010 [Burkholderia sp.]
MRVNVNGFRSIYATTPPSIPLRPHVSIDATTPISRPRILYPSLSVPETWLLARLLECCQAC